MTTDRQIRANRLNALRSTGPTTPEGKDVSRRNAMTHGLTAEKIVIEGEDAEIFTRFREEVAAYYAPVGLAEDLLLERLVGFAWRLRRIPAFDAAIHEWVRAQQAREIVVDPFELDDGLLPAGRIYSRGDTAGKTNRNDQIKLGRVLEHLLRGDVYSKLARYEAHLLRQSRETLKDLEQLQKVRTSGTAMAGEFDAKGRAET